MIAHLVGKITERSGNVLVFDVAGIGYEVTVSGVDAENYPFDEIAKVYTYHHVREQDEELYGFSSLEGKKLFELLITVQGVGPKAAIGILSLGVPTEVRNAIASSDSKYIARASGVGKKTADRVIVDLVDKVGFPGASADVGALTAGVGVDEALEALMALGFTLNDASKALAEVDKKLPVPERVRAALKNQ